MYYKLDQRRFARKLAKKGDTYTFNSGKDFLDFLAENSHSIKTDSFDDYYDDHLFNLSWELVDYFSSAEGYQFVDEDDLDESGEYELWNGDKVGVGVYSDDCELQDYDKESFLLNMLEQMSYGLSLYDVITLEDLGGEDWVWAKLTHTDIKMKELLENIAEWEGYELVSFEEGDSTFESRTENCKITILDTGEND